MRNWIGQSELPRERHGTVNEGVVVVMSEDREPSRMRVEAGGICSWLWLGAGLEHYDTAWSPIRQGFPRSVPSVLGDEVRTDRLSPGRLISDGSFHAVTAEGTAETETRGSRTVLATWRLRTRHPLRQSPPLRRLMCPFRRAPATEQALGKPPRRPWSTSTRASGPCKIQCILFPLSSRPVLFALGTYYFPLTLDTPHESSKPVKRKGPTFLARQPRDLRTCPSHPPFSCDRHPHFYYHVFCYHLRPTW
jgi:hypothetical protein